MPEDDEGLIRAIAQRDSNAWRQLYDLYRPRLRRYLWHQLGGDATMVEDVMQEIFLGIWRNAAQYRGDAKLATWIFTIAHYCANHARRDQQRRPEKYRAHVSEQSEAAEQGIHQEPFEDEVIARLSLAESFQQLSVKHREVIILAFQQGFTLEEIAQILDVPVGTVKSRISYARRALQHELAITRQRERES